MYVTMIPSLERSRA